MGWTSVAEIVGGVVLLALVAPVLWLWLRRRLLSGEGGLFDCALRLDTSTPRSGWATGMARYDGEVLNWYRTFSFAWGPKVQIRRDDVHVLGQRLPEAAEAVVLFGDDKIIRLAELDHSHERVLRELAMNPESLTGLLSWLEAAPPRGDIYRRS